MLPNLATNMHALWLSAVCDLIKKTKPTLILISGIFPEKPVSNNFKHKRITFYIIIYIKINCDLRDYFNPQ